jgi:hypothetical protein
MDENNPKPAAGQSPKPFSTNLKLGFLTPFFNKFIPVFLFIVPIIILCGMGYFLVFKVYRKVSLPATAPFGEKLFEYLIVLLIPSALVWIAIDWILPEIENNFPQTKPYLAWVSGKGVKLLSTFVKGVILVGAALLALRFLSNMYGWGLPFDSGDLGK